jgi:hypothetical protein
VDAERKGEQQRFGGGVLIEGASTSLKRVVDLWAAESRYRIAEVHDDERQKYESRNCLHTDESRVGHSSLPAA